MVMIIMGIVSLIYTFNCLLDFLYYRLPNKLFYSLFYLFPLQVIFTKDYSILSHYSAFLVFLVIGFGLFTFSVFDAGDAKLLAVSSLWLGWSKLIPFLLVMALIGGMIGLVFMVWPSLMHHLSKTGRQVVVKNPYLSKIACFFINDLNTINGQVRKMEQKRLVPYGIAISIAAILSLWGDI